MKDSEFIELLNLYLDHEISAVDAKRLEVEVQSSPSRYRVYREYCQMQKACVVWAEKAALDLPVDAKIITFPSPKTSWEFGTYAAGVCAVAACLALVFVVQGGRGSATTAPKPSDPTLIASVYGMNFQFMPELSQKWGYPFALTLMFASAVVPMIYFRRRGWLK